MGIPLRDISRRPTHRPVITVSIIVINVLVFLLELARGDAFIEQWSVIPAHIVAGQGWITILTAMFMHAGWIILSATCCSFGPSAQPSKTPWVRFAIWPFTSWAAWSHPWLKSRH